MDTRTEYCGAILINNIFQWNIYFIGETNTVDCETGNTHFNAIKKLLKTYVICPYLCGVGTDGCEAITTTQNYYIVYAQG